MNPINVLPLQITAVVVLIVVLLALRLRSGTGSWAKLRRGLLLLDRYAIALAGLLASLALAVAVGAGAWQVISRFATATPAVWSEALVRTALIWMAFLGLGVALRAGALVAIDVAHRYARGGVRLALEATSLAAALSLLGVMWWFGWLMAERVRFQEMAGLEISMSWGYAAIPVGAVFAIMGAIGHFLERGDREAEPLP